MRAVPLRRDRRGAEETFQALPAVLITIVVVGLVFGVVAAAGDGAREREAHDRARLQAEIFVEALSFEPALEESTGAVSWEGALSVARKDRNLTFVPPHACVASLLDTQGVEELFLFGVPGGLSPNCVVVSLPTPIIRQDGTVVPGVLRAGVLPE